ncbi:MAG: molecular chaperone DnaJ [Clostridia bacterium]|nr:molecular chaperone DnaJ [Clostridia bacterium]
MADKRDYYEVLGVDKGASDSEIKSAFRRKAKECHPDLHPDDKVAEAQFKELNEAYEVLSDSDKRAKYDQFGHAAFDPSMGGGNPFTGGGFSGFGDIIDQVFGGGFGGFGGYSSATRNGPVQGNDLRYSLTLTFEEAAFGVKKEILIPREESCPTCSGSGAKPGTTPTRCTTCGGTGQVRTQQQTMFGSFASTRPCSACKGTGKIITDPCSDCRGTGRIRKNTRIAVSVPAGIDNGQTISLAGEGEDGLRGGPRGDLYVSITVKPHKLFTRRGYDIYLDMPIAYTTAVLGGEIVVPTLKENVKYSIPAGTQSGSTFRLRGQGIPRLNRDGRGDLLVTVTIDVPKRLNDKQKEALEAFRDACSDSPAPKPGKKTLFSKVKEAFND